MLGVGDYIPNDIRQENLQDASCLLVDEADDALHSSSSLPSNRRLHDSLAVVPRDFPVECFTTNDQALAGHPRFSPGKYLGYEYAFFGFTSYSPYWREVRKIAAIELLSTRQLELLKHVRAAEVNMEALLNGDPRAANVELSGLLIKHMLN
ncbi:hypothetical protein MRB53_016054 [Persea americana]|uniref:Uncharacterized protein n=1 Tax=Persea americana TaxID=3435 RepID=A0ACC2M160_PERAE|nr:hypothetical protein MRB53_016054 [Persea americana]